MKCGKRDLDVFTLWAEADLFEVSLNENSIVINYTFFRSKRMCSIKTTESCL